VSASSYKRHSLAFGVSDRVNQDMSLFGLVGLVHRLIRFSQKVDLY